mmetsp:Transcript_245/g.463  ORF Transcript_245/g.463 Transcript_245/m.463 type:complete len:224 (+) Transcript_245:784-1455(+)
MEAQERIAIRELIQIGAIPPGIPTKERLSKSLKETCENLVACKEQNTAATTAQTERDRQEAMQRFETHSNIIDLLLTANADPNNAGGIPPIFAMTQGMGGNRKISPGDFDKMHAIMGKLLRAGADVDRECPLSKCQGQTALIQAAALGLPETVRFLIGHGANVNVVDREAGDTALSLCELRCRSIQSRRRIFWILLRAGTGFKGYLGSKLLRNWLWFIGRQST